MTQEELSLEFDDDLLELIEKMHNSVDVQDIDVDTELSEVVTIRETILDTYKVQIDELKDKTGQKHKEIYDRAADMATKELKSYIDDKVQEGCEITTDLLTKKADDIKANMRGTISEETKKKFGVEDLIPSLNYTDYLRLLLLLDQQEESVKLSRVMDLVQMNIQKKYDDYDKTLTNYFRGVSIEATLYSPVNNQLPVDRRLKNKLWEYLVEENAKY